MKILITENQFKKLIKIRNIKDIDEDSSDPSSLINPTTDIDPTPKSGASDEQKGGEGYPEVTTWEDIVGSKLTRGPANQIKLTKWSDVVGSAISRGTANQLK